MTVTGSHEDHRGGAREPTEDSRASAARPSRRALATPTHEGYVERDGVRVFWERYGDGEPTVLLLPTWSIVHSRFWKMQIPYLARHCRVRDVRRPRQRPLRPAGRSRGDYSTDEFAADALAVMDATGTERATLVALSCGALWATMRRRRPSRAGERDRLHRPGGGSLAPHSRARR